VANKLNFIAEVAGDIRYVCSESLPHFTESTIEVIAEKVWACTFTVALFPLPKEQGWAKISWPYLH
jgi:hypothetical protein